MCGPYVIKDFLFLVLISKETSKFERARNNIRTEMIISASIWSANFFSEVSALLDVRHCPKLQSCAISRKSNDATLKKWQNP